MMKVKRVSVVLALVMVIASGGVVYAALPAGWFAGSSSGLLGGPIGTVSYDGGVWTIQVPGGMMLSRDSSSPSTTYAYTNREGDWKITARVLSLDRAVELTLGEGVGYGAEAATIVVYESSGIHARFGCTGMEADAFAAVENIGLPCWVRIERVGDEVSGYVSPDAPGGPHWTLIGSAMISLSAQVSAGMGVYPSCDVATLQCTPTSGRFDNVSVEPAAPAPGGWKVSGGNIYATVPGNVGIGTTNPARKLHVSGGDILLDDGQYVTFMNAEGRINQTLTLIHETAAGVNRVVLVNFLTGPIEFYTGQAEGHAQSRVIITSAGNVGIGTSPSEKLDVNGTARLRGLGAGGGATVVADSNGKLWKQSSSRRYKEDIHALETDPGKVLDLDPVRFRWKTTGELDVGLIAEDVAGRLEDLVIYDQDGRPDGVKYDKLALYLLSVVKAQQQKIERLEAAQAERDQLTQKIDALEKTAQQSKAGSAETRPAVE